MTAAVASLLLLSAVSFTLAVAMLPHFQRNKETLAAADAVNEVLVTVTQPHCSVIFFLDGSTWATTVFTEMDQLVVPWGIVVLEATLKRHEANLTQPILLQMIGKALKLQHLSWCVRVVVASEDPSFLASFASSSLEGRLLVWSSRLLVLTRLPLRHLQHLHTTFSITNAMLLIVEDHQGSIKCNVYVHLPFSPEGSPALRVASWTPHRGLILTSNLQLFPDKFAKLLHRPTLVVTGEESEPHIALMRDGDIISSPLSFTGPMIILLDILATSINFTYTYVRPPDGSWGMKLENGSWTGMVGMVGRKEADAGLGPFDVTAPRSEIVDFTSAVLTETVRIVGARGRPEVDPWGFLLPLAPLVWAAILAALLLLSAAILLLSTASGLKTASNTSSLDVIFAYSRVVLQQDNPVLPYLWWERLVLGVWMMMTLVLTRSYAGNLMSYLAVRHIPQAYHTFRDVLDDQSVTMLWEGDTSYVQYFRSMKSGVFREIADSEKQRIKYVRSVEFNDIMDTLVRQGDHVLVTGNQYGKVLKSHDFSRTGRCDFYTSKEGYMPAMSSMIGQKDSPLVAAMTKRINLITEAGLYDYWTEAYMPNNTFCAHLPAKIAVNSSLSFHNLWGMFLVLLGGLTLSLFVLLFEFLSSAVLHSVTS